MPVTVQHAVLQPAAQVVIDLLSACPDQAADISLRRQIDNIVTTVPFREREEQPCQAGLHREEHGALQPVLGNPKALTQNAGQPERDLRRPVQDWQEIAPVEE